MLISDFVTVSFRQVLRNWTRYQGVMIIISIGIAGLIVSPQRPAGRECFENPGAASALLDYSVQGEATDQ